MKLIKMFYDCETTGTNPKRHSIHQLAGMIEVDGIIKDKFNFKIRPNPKAEIIKEALDVSNVTKEQILAYPPMEEIYKELIKILKKYVNKYDKKNKIFKVGFNNRKFDDLFLRSFFEQNGDKFFNSWFWSDSHDAMVSASVYLQKRRHNMPSFKLHRVAKELGIVVVDSKLHDALYDIMLTRQVYRITTGLEIEL